MYHLDLELDPPGTVVHSETLTDLGEAIQRAYRYNLDGFRVYITGGGRPSWPDYDYYLVPPGIETAEQWLAYMDRCDEEARAEIIEAYAAESRCHPQFWS
jgi:hypothetical protein